MALVQKVNPINEDRVISIIQEHLYNNLLSVGFTNYESYERIYVNNGSPEVYLKNGQYKEVFYNDRFYLTSFFMIGNNKVYNELNDINTEISIVFQANLTKLYPTVLHRADAELHRDIELALDAIPVRFKIKEIITGIDNVYSGLTFKNKQYLNDVSSSHLCKFVLDVDYSNKKCNK